MYLLILLEIVVEVGAAAQLQDRAEAIVVDLHRVVVLNHAPVIQLFVDLVLPQSVLDVVIFDLVCPTVVKVVDLAGNFATVLQIKRFVHFREASLSKNRKNQVLVVQDGERLAPMDAAIL